jgi:hypothetical protein
VINACSFWLQLWLPFGSPLAGKFHIFLCCFLDPFPYGIFPNFKRSWFRKWLPKRSLPRPFGSPNPPETPWLYIYIYTRLFRKQHWKIANFLPSARCGGRPKVAIGDAGSSAHSASPLALAGGRRPPRCACTI